MAEKKSQAEGVGGRIREVRLARGMTLEELADKTKISKSFLWEVEQNRSDIAGEKLVRIANVFGASLDYLLRGKASAESFAPVTIEIPAELDELAHERGWTYRQTSTLLDIANSVKHHRRNERFERTRQYWEKLFEAVKPFLGNHDKERA